ncbi:CD59 glycoprotein-like [Pantherophis guttatus]|uniref:MAC-inhibitory protein n=1 Tax=Pantherophis guttatus TaxID=94885 RepID=A0A6P9C0G8_PANGU|nr:CD59 glycoprotein-like [Pantherophis guttatus]
MKSLLVTAVITTFVLALFLHSGNALVCYNCDFANCDKNITCTGDKDTCLIVYQGVKNSSRCWKYSDCNVDFISNSFGTKNFRYRCCQWNLCNNAPNVVTSKIVLSGTFLLTVVHMLKSLVWN